MNLTVAAPVSARAPGTVATIQTLVINITSTAKMAVLFGCQRAKEKAL